MWLSRAAAFSIQRVGTIGTHPSRRHISINLRTPGHSQLFSTILNEEILSKDEQTPFKMNLVTIDQHELESLLISWNQPKYRASQILHWINDRGITNVDEMDNIPKRLRNLLKQHTSVGTLETEVEMISKDGTIKRAYRLWDGQLIESVLMPYTDGRYTACISSQAGCAMGCVFCSTGQMGFARQLTAEEIYEQVCKFAIELKRQDKRLSNIVMMGMGEPLANYRNVMTAIRRINKDLGIGARKITISTVGIVPNIRKLIEDDLQVRLAVSLHCSDDDQRSELLPANRRYGGLDELMSTVKEYIDRTGRRVTFEWALIEGQNDTPEIARQLGNLLKRHEIRRDMAHINLIPLNPSGGYSGTATGRLKVNEFVAVLDKEFGLKATPRVRRGIDIEAGCGQLKAAVKKREQDTDHAQSNKLKSHVNELKSFVRPKENLDTITPPPSVGVYEDDDEDEDFVGMIENVRYQNQLQHGESVEFALQHDVVDLDSDADFVDPEYEHEYDKKEAARLISLVQQSTLSIPTITENEPENSSSSASRETNDTTSITDEDSIRKAKRRRKKLIKNLKAIDRLRQIEQQGKTLSNEQLVKVQKESSWRMELESVEHNLK